MWMYSNTLFPQYRRGSSKLRFLTTQSGRQASGGQLPRWIQGQERKSVPGRNCGRNNCAHQWNVAAMWKVCAHYEQLWTPCYLCALWSEASTAGMWLIQRWSSPFSLAWHIHEVPKLKIYCNILVNTLMLLSLCPWRWMATKHYMNKDITLFF